MIPTQSKHKGDVAPWLPCEAYHKSNPKFRDQITVEGLKLMKGESYALHSPEDNEPPAIFAYFGDFIEGYETGYIDDVWAIDMNKIPHVWYQDMQVGGNAAIVTYDGMIPAEALSLIYKGTGEVDPNF